MTAEIVTMPTPLATLAADIRSLYEGAENDKQGWIDKTLRLAAKMAEARNRFASDREFGHWIVDNDLDSISKDDRVALIGFASNLDIARAILEETHRTSWKWIWRERAREFSFRQVANAEPSPGEIENRPEPTPAPPPVDSAPPEAAVSAVPQEPRPQPEHVSERSLLHGLPRAEEVAAFYLEPKTRTTLGKVFRTRGGRAVWDLVLAAIDGGVVTPNHAIIRPSPPTAMTMLNLRLVLPDAPTHYATGFNLLKPSDRKIVAEEILPAAIANREAYLANPSDLERIVARHGRPDPVTLRVARQEVAVRRATGAGQQRIVVFGETMWPHEQGLYDYDQIRCAIWLFRDYEAMFRAPPGQDPASRADYVKISMIWLNQYIARIKRTMPPERHADKVLRVLAMLHKVADLMQRNPTGECVFPYSPNVEGEW